MPWVPVHVKPAVWFVCFHRSSPTWWIQRFLPFRFKHVSCFGKVDGQDAWVFLDFAVDGPSLAIVPDRQEGMRDRQMAEFTRDAVVLSYRPPGEPRRWWQPFALCTTNVASMIGTSSRALRASRLLRDLLREGATIVAEPADESSTRGAGAASRAHRATAGDPPV